MDMFQGYERIIGNYTKKWLKDIGNLINKKAKINVVFMNSGNNDDALGWWLGLVTGNDAKPMDEENLKPIEDRLNKFNYMAQQGNDTSPLEKALAIAGQLAQSAKTGHFIKRHFKTICFSKDKLHSALDQQSHAIDEGNIKFVVKPRILYIALSKNKLQDSLTSVEGLSMATDITNKLRETVGFRANLRNRHNKNNENKNA